MNQLALIPEALPTPKAVRPHIAHPSCEFCHGTGWETREVTLQSGPFAGEKREGNAKCRCGGTPPRFDMRQIPGSV